MFKLFKWLLYLIILAFVVLVGYVYIGPFFGADFAPPESEVRQDIILNVD